MGRKLSRAGRQTPTGHAKPVPQTIPRLDGRARAVALLGVLAFGVAFAAVRLLPAVAPLAPPGMVWVPGGEFTVGTDAAVVWADEKPAHQVRVGGFFIDETEVTNAQFRAFVEATGYVTCPGTAPSRTASGPGSGRSTRPARSGTPTRPARPSHSG